MAGRLAGKVAIVSGGARGMGASHVRALAGEGAKVILGDVLDTEGEKVANEVCSTVPRGCATFTSMSPNPTTGKPRFPLQWTSSDRSTSW